MYFPNTSKPKNNENEKITEPIVAYRVWKRDCGYLYSAAYSNFKWPLRKPLEKDILHDEGIHAVRSAKQVMQLLSSYETDVAGSVYLWGEIREFALGYTAQFAYPKELWMPECSDPTEVMKLEDNYGVVVHLRYDMAKYISKTALQLLHRHQYMQALQNARQDMLKYGQGTVQFSPGAIIPYDTP